MRKVRGIGINDTEIAGPACTNRDEQGRKFNLIDYSVWYGILVRATHEMPSSPNSYLDTKVCDEWLVRSNFQKWFFSHETFYDNSGERLEVDKDILVRGNREYSPEKCALIPIYINTSLNLGVNSTSGLPMWVSYRERNPDMKSPLKKPFRSAITENNRKYKHVGYFKTAEEAHHAAQALKIISLEATLERYKLEKCFRQDVYDALAERVLKLKTDHTNHVETTTI